MSRSTDPDHFFQSHDSELERQRKKKKSKNENGIPIHFSSKILAVIADPVDAGAVYIAQSDGKARRIVLETKSTSQLYSGPTVPITSLALVPDCTTLFAGCWDKTIWSWNISSRQVTRRYHGHNDFVKSLLCLNVKGLDLLISGSADACIIIWNVESGERLFNLKGGHTRGILDLAVDPATLPYVHLERDVEISVADGHGDTGVQFFSAGSDRSIRRWRFGITMTKDNQRTLHASEIETDHPILVHETSVFHLCFDPNDDNELWTASADGTVKCLSRERSWEVDTSIEHGDYVDSVAVSERWVISAGRNEDVKIWDRAWSLKPEDLRIAIEKEERGERGEEDGESGKKSVDNDLAEDEDAELEELMREEQEGNEEDVRKED
ncbi:hypothetical protein P7C71_g1355, partial [Lecanoromycetidae sp. Uapishka_2]